MEGACSWAGGGAALPQSSTLGDLVPEAEEGDSRTCRSSSSKFVPELAVVIGPMLECRRTKTRTVCLRRVRPPGRKLRCSSDRDEFNKSTTPEGNLKMIAGYKGQ